MKYILILLIIPFRSSGQVPIVFPDISDDFSSSYSDMEIYEDDIWIYRAYSNTTSHLQLTKYDHSGAILVTGPIVSSDYRTEFRWADQIMAIDDEGHVYASNVYHGQDGSDDINLYKIDRDGNLSWEVTIPTANTHAEFSNGLIVGDNLLCGGYQQSIDETQADAWLLNVSITDGSIIYNKITEEPGLETYSDLVQRSDKIYGLKFKILSESENEYASTIVELDENGSTISEYTVPVSGLLGTDLFVLNDHDVLVSGYVDGLSHITKLNLHQEIAIWGETIMDAFDDFDYDLSLYQDKIIGTHTTFPQGLNDLPGSAVEAFFSIQDTNGILIDSFFIDYTDQEETIVRKSLIHSDRIYFCGEEVVSPFFLNPPNGFWGFVDLSEFLVSSENIPIVQDKTSIYPNPNYSMGIVHTYDHVFNAYQIFDIQGMMIENGQTEMPKNQVELPIMKSGLYTIVLHSDQYISCHKLIIH